MENDLISVREYAELKGCSTTAVYKRLETTLKKYKKKVKGKTYLSSKIIEDEGLETVLNHNDGLEPNNQPLNPTVANGSKPGNERLNPTVERDLERPSPDLAEITLETIKLLQSQIEAKDREINRLHLEIEDCRAQIAEYARHNQEHTDTLSNLLAQAQELNKNNQILLAQANNKGTELPEGKKKNRFKAWFLGE